jgi:hypothetical protein
MLRYPVFRSVGSCITLLPNNFLTAIKSQGSNNACVVWANFFIMSGNILNKPINGDTRCRFHPLINLVVALIWQVPAEPSDAIGTWCEDYDLSGLAKKQSTHNASPTAKSCLLISYPVQVRHSQSKRSFVNLGSSGKKSPANAALGRHRQVLCRTSDAHNVAPLKQPCSISTSMTYAPKVPPG